MYRQKDKHVQIDGRTDGQTDRQGLVFIISILPVNQSGVGAERDELRMGRHAGQVLE